MSDFVRTLRQFASDLAGAARLEVALRVCVRAVREVEDVDCAGVYLIDEPTGALHLAYQEGASKRFVSSAASYPADSEHARLVRRGRPHYARSARLARVNAPGRRSEGLRTIGVVPILHERRVVGCLNAGSRRTSDFTARTRDEIEALAAQTGAAFSRLQAEEALRESESRQRLLIEAITDAIMFVDQHGRVEFVNSAAASVLGMQAGKLVGRAAAEALRETRLGGVWDDLRDLLVATPARPQVREIAMVGAPPTTWEFRVYPAKTGVLCIWNDVSERSTARRVQREYQRRLQDLAAGITDAGERQRRRTSIELHDRVGQELLGAKLRLGLLSRDTRDAEAREALADALTLIDGTMSRLAALAQEIYPPALFELGLASALEWLARRFTAESGIQCELSMQPGADRASEEVNSFLFEATRELLGNVARHADATRARVEVAETDAELGVTVKDDGRGPADDGHGEEAASGFGLLALRERLRQTGGRLDIEFTAGEGSCLTVTVPRILHQNPRRAG